MRALVAQHVKLDAAGPYRFALTDGAVPPLQPADDPDAGARPGRRRAAAYPRAGRAHSGRRQLPAAGIDRPRRRIVGARAAGPSRTRAAGRSCGGPRHGAEVGRRDARAHPSPDEHGPRRARAAASARRAVRRDGARLLRDLSAGEPAALAARRLLRRTGHCGLQCLHRRPPEPRLARHRVVAARQCVAVHRGGARVLSQRGRPSAPGALSLRPAGDRGAARTGGGRAMADPPPRSARVVHCASR